MSEDEKRLQDQETEDEPETDDSTAASTDLPDTDTSEGDPPIIIQRGGTGTPG